MSGHRFPPVDIPLWALLAAAIAVPWCASGSVAEPAATGEMFGIGAVLAADGDYPVVSQLASGGAAEREGRLKVGDHITGVAEGDSPFVDCKGKDVHQVVALTRGKAESIVRLEVLPAGATDPSKREVISIVRGLLMVTSLSPDDQAALDALIKSLPPLMREPMTEEMRKTVADVVRATGLDASGSNALETAASDAVEECLQKTAGHIGDKLAAQLEQLTPEQRPMFLGQGATQLNPDGEPRWKDLQAQSGELPTDQPAWKDALKKGLTPARQAIWQGVLAKQREDVENQIRGYVDHIAQIASGLYLQQFILPSAAEVRAELNPTPEEAARLTALENSVASAYGDTARASAEKILLAMAPDARARAIGRPNYYNWLPPLSNANWEGALARLLTPDEKKRLASAKEDRKNQQARAMGRLMLALMDDRVALTAAQRQRLEPIAEELAKEASDLQPRNMNGFYTISASSIYGAAAGGSGDDIKAILDPIQWQHWQDAAQLKNLPYDGEDVENPIQLPAVDAASSPTPAPGPEDAQRAISDYLADKSGTERAAVFAEKMLKAEDAVRVLHLPAIVAGHLETAARGSADAYMARWNMAAVQTVQDSLGGASPETLKQQLANIQDYELQNAVRNNRFTPSREESLLDATIKADLTPGQRKALKAETDARQAYRAEAITGWIACSFAEDFGLSPDQTAKLEPMIGKVRDKYARGIANFFSFNSWYLESFYMYLPIEGIPDKDLQGLLSKAQWDRWNGSEQRSVATSYWTNIARATAQAGGGD